jgi:hypothetical protein
VNVVVVDVVIVQPNAGAIVNSNIAGIASASIRSIGEMKIGNDSIIISCSCRLLPYYCL